MMRSITGKLLGLALPALMCSVPALAGPVYDVEIRLVPTLTPWASDELSSGAEHFTSRYDPALQRYVERVDWPTDQGYALEVWVSDNNGTNTPNTGLVSAYLDVSWDNGTITEAMTLAYHREFDVLREGMINNPSNVLNFGASHLGDPVLGIEPSFVRVGWIDYGLLGPGVVNLDAVVGLGEIGVLNRSVGDVHIIGATVVPEPGSLVLLALAALAIRRRRYAVSID